MKVTSLQYVRGFAALLVVYFHIGLQLEIATPDSSILPVLGSVGVDVFFVLSGFVMWISTQHETTLSPLRFYRRRIGRVVPLYWLITVAAVLAAAVVPQTARSVHLAIDHVLASFFFVPWPNPAFPAGNPNEMTPVIVPGWTLNYEMFFYLIFGLVLPFRKSLRIGLMLACFVSLWIAHLLLRSSSPILVFYTSSYLFEFLAGAVVAVLALRVNSLPAHAAVSSLVVGVVTLLLFEFRRLQVLPLLSGGLPAILIIVGAVYIERAGRLLESGFLALMGDASYSIYLVHGVAISIVRMLWSRSGLSFSAVEQIGFATICLVSGIGLGLLVFIWIERPLLGLGRRRESDGVRSS